MTQVYLCDDQQIVLTNYASLLHKIADQYSFDIHINTFSSGEQLLFFYEETNQPPDVIFLDILMGGENGLAIAQKLREQNCPSEIIFLTANAEYVFDSFDVSPANYIIKNSISPKRFADIFLKAISMAAKRSRAVFSCENNNVQKNIPVYSITHFEVRNRIVTVYYDKSSFDFYATLEDVVQKLNSPVFLRVHRSFLVHLQKIEEIGSRELTLINGQTIPIGITYTHKVKESMSRYFSLFG